jgi:hypothetical protein
LYAAAPVQGKQVITLFLQLLLNNNNGLEQRARHVAIVHPLPLKTFFRFKILFHAATPLGRNQQGNITATRDIKRPVCHGQQSRFEQRQPGFLGKFTSSTVNNGFILFQSTTGKLPACFRFSLLRSAFTHEHMIPAPQNNSNTGQRRMLIVDGGHVNNNQVMTGRG